MAFGHAQLLLYRPFLHYASQSYKDKTVDQSAFICASACVSVSRNIIHIGTEMRWQGLLAESFWFSTYTIFFAVVSVVYLVLQDPTNPISFELLRDAMKGRKMLVCLAKRSMAADSCSSALMVCNSLKRVKSRQYANLPYRACLRSSLNQPGRMKKSWNLRSDAEKPHRNSSQWARITPNVTTL
jgi:hypothetical protein